MITETEKIEKNENKTEMEKLTAEIK